MVRIGLIVLLFSCMLPIYAQEVPDSAKMAAYYAEMRQKDFGGIRALDYRKLRSGIIFCNLLGDTATLQEPKTQRHLHHMHVELDTATWDIKKAKLSKFFQTVAHLSHREALYITGDSVGVRLLCMAYLHTLQVSIDVQYRYLGIDFMESIQKEIQHRYGNAEYFFYREVGLTEAWFERLREQLLIY